MRPQESSYAPPSADVKKATENICCYKWDNKLLLSDPYFGQKLHNRAYDQDAANKAAFPNDYILALFAQQAYKNENYELPNNWELLTTATNNDKTNGYFGVAFWNPKLCKVVVAHRGTKLLNIGALISDLLLALNKEKSGQSQSAATFVQLVSDQIKAKNSKDDCHFHLSITGHSLGAWLAQVTTFTVKYFKHSNESENFSEDENYVSNIHAHTVVFESPGCKEAFVKLVRYFVPRYVHRKYGNYDTLDMTVYLSQLNPINSINEHVGTIYIVRSQTHSIKDTIRLFDSTTGKIEKEMVLDFRSGMLAACRSFFKKLVPYSSTKILKKRVNENEYSLNVFNEKELDFVKDWVHVVNLNFPKILQFKRKNTLSDFEVDDEYNIIRGHDVNSTIACIKRMRPTKTVILELIKSDADVRVHYEIFKLKTQQFQRDLLQFKDYYFRDKYKLKEFLKSRNSQILHIRVNRKSALEYGLETSILNSVFTFYKNTEPDLVKDSFTQEQYGFVTWHKLQEVLNIVPDMFENYKVNLLVIECFEMENQDKEAILQFLKKTAVKLILLSTDQISWRKDIPDIQEVKGFGDNIQFQDLTTDCQKDFFMQKNLKLHERDISLYDIINAEFPLSDEVYKHLNRAISPDMLLELMLTSITEAIVMDCPFNNLLKGVIFLDLYRKVERNKLLKLKYDENSLFIIQGDENTDWIQSDNSERNTSNFIIKNDINFTKECFENFNKIVYLFSIENNKLFLTNIFNKNFYISRNIIRQRSISSFIFEDLSDDYDQYYVCGDESKFMQYLNKDKKEQFRFVASEKVAKQRIKNARSTTHLFKIEGERIEWLYSRGNVEYLRKYLEMEKDYVDEVKIMDNEDIVIISGEPGMGKSSTLGLQFWYLQKTHWVFAIPLRHSVFGDLDAEMNSSYAAAFILKTCGISNLSCIEHLLSYCLKNETYLPICLLFDAFDEIREVTARKRFIELINFLKYSCKVKILITTRRYRCKELENGISAFAYTFEPISSETKAVDFLTNFWNCQLYLFEDSTDINELKRFARNMLQDAEDILGETISNFIGVPMHLRMIGEVIAPSSSSSAQTTAVDILSLFQKYTQIRYNLYFKKFGFTKNETIQRWLSDHISAKHYQLAILQIFDINMKSIEYKDMEELNNVGIIQSDSDNSFNYEFLHDSVRDYFVAYLLKLWLEPCFQLFHGSWDVEKFIVSDFLLHPEYKEIRFFLNRYLKNLSVSKERLEMCHKKLKQLWETDQSQFFIDEESVFHVCAKENLCFLTKKFLFPVTDKINKVELLSKRNSDLETPLFLAARATIPYKNANAPENIFTIFLEELNQCQLDDIKSILLASLFVHFISDEYINTFKKCSENYANIYNRIGAIQFEQMNVFLEACKSNDPVRINILVEQYQNDKITRNYLLQVTNELKETCLHLTTNTELVERLLKLGVNKNSQDHHGMTPLARAIKCGNTEIATILIRKGADPSITDDMRNSPLHHSAKYNNLEVAKLILNSKNTKVDVDDNNTFGVTPLMLAAKNGNESFVRYLLDKGASVAATDWNEMTPVFHAVKGGNSNLIRIFRQKGADINIKDGFGITPVLHSIMKHRWNLVNSLLDNGADVNIGSPRNGYPLQLLIKMDKPAIIKKIAKENNKITKDEASDVTKPFKTYMLSEEEMEYINNLLDIKMKK